MATSMKMSFKYRANDKIAGANAEASSMMCQKVTLSVEDAIFYYNRSGFRLESETPKNSPPG